MLRAALRGRSAASRRHARQLRRPLSADPFPRTATSKPSEWIPPKRDGGDDQGQAGSGPAAEDWIVPGVHVLWDDSVAMRLRRRTKLLWASAPRTVLLVKKWEDATVTSKMREIAGWLTDRGARVLVEAGVHANEMPEYEPFCVEDGAEEQPLLDFAVTLGGDGTLLHLANMFSGDGDAGSARPPPVVSFGMGTLGFLTPFDVVDYEEILGCLLKSNEVPMYATLRTRLRCEVVTPENEVSAVTHVMNECVIDRGRLSLCTLETAVDGHHVTTVHGDGLIVSTPSGSTAYNLSAGGALVAPSVPCTLLTPIAPHSLASRPFIVAEQSHIEVKIPHDMDVSGTRATFDGRTVVPLPAGSKVGFCMGRYPIPIINMNRHDMDWFNSLTLKLHWKNASIED